MFCPCSRSSVGVKHVAVFDHDLSDADRIATGLALTSALEADNNTLTVGSRRVAISGKTEMLVAEEKGNAMGGGGGAEMLPAPLCMSFLN